MLERDAAEISRAASDDAGGEAHAAGGGGLSAERRAEDDADARDEAAQGDAEGARNRAAFGAASVRDAADRAAARAREARRTADQERTAPLRAESAGVDEPWAVQSPVDVDFVDDEGEPTLKRNMKGLQASAQPGEARHRSAPAASPDLANLDEVAEERAARGRLGLSISASPPSARSRCWRSTSPLDATTRATRSAWTPIRNNKKRPSPSLPHVRPSVIYPSHRSRAAPRCCC